MLVNDEKVWDRTDADPVTGDKVGSPETKILKRLEFSPRRAWATQTLRYQVDKACFL